MAARARRGDQARGPRAPAPTARPRARRRRSPPTSRRSCCAPSGSTSSSRTSPSSTTGSGAAARMRTTASSRASRSTTRSSSSPPFRPASSSSRAATTSIRLVLTAHPTEATRRTVLLAHIRIADQLVRLDDPRLAPDERAEVEERLAEEVTLLWQTDEVRHDRLRITDEIRNGLWFFEHSLISAATDLLHAWRERVPGSPPPLTFGSWIGGDMDGNPAAGPASIAEALDEARKVALRRYRDEVRELAVEIASTRSLVRVSDRARGVARPRRDGAARVRRGDRRPQRARAVSPQAVVHVVATRQRRLSRAGRPARRPAHDPREPGGERRAPGRRRTGRPAGADGRALRLPHRQARPAAARTRPRRATRPGGGRGGRRGARTARQRGARHADRVRHVERGRRGRRRRAHRRTALDRAALRDARRPDRSAAHPGRVAAAAATRRPR